MSEPKHDELVDLLREYGNGECPHGQGSRQECAECVAAFVASRIAQAREQMEEIVNEELSDWGGPERILLNARRDAILTRLRQLAEHVREGQGR